MDLQTRYITKDEFRDYTGRNLDEELAGREAPETLIHRVTDRLETWLNSKYYQNIALKYPEFTDYQKEHYKKALIEQVLYILENGDISVDSGYNPDVGIIANTDTLSQVIISPNSKMHLEVCGLLSRKIRTCPRTGFLWW